MPRASEADRNAPASLEEAQRFLERSPDHEKRPDVNYDRRNFNLDRTRAVLDALGNPQKNLRVIHVAGTKGKGTTCALVERCLREAGYRTGLFTSPHLRSICERMRVGGRSISEEDFCGLVGAARSHIEDNRQNSPAEAPTYFEILTGLAIRYFADQEVEWAVAEVGLGGRLDSTNVLQPECCIITSIGYDHMDKLGDTIEAIAGEKAGIMKDRTPVIIGRQRYDEAREVLKDHSQSHCCPCWEVGTEVRVDGQRALTARRDNPNAPVGWQFDLNTPASNYLGLTTSLLGAHQLDNCAGAVAALELLRERNQLEISEQSIRRGVHTCICPARVEVLQRQPALLLDTAHTVESIEALLEAVKTHFPGRRLRIVFGCSADKDYSSMLRALAGHCKQLILTRADFPRAADPERLATAAEQAGFESTKTVVPATQALETCLAEAAPDDVVCVTGSFYVAGEIRLNR